MNRMSSLLRYYGVIFRFWQTVLSLQILLNALKMVGSC